MEGLSLIDPDLEGGNGVDVHREQFENQRLMQPQAAGRGHTLSEVALVFNKSARVTLNRWNGGRPEFGDSLGAGERVEIIERVLSNEHPHYADWIGRVFGPEDEGKTLCLIEVGIVPELFSVAQGYRPIHPNRTLQLRRGAGPDSAPPLSVNGIPLGLWGTSLDLPNSPFRGPALMTPNVPRADPANDSETVSTQWLATGGPGGIYIMRFGTFQITPDEPGYGGDQFLPNGPGPLEGLFSQTPVIVEENEMLHLRQDGALSLALFSKSRAGADAASLSQLFYLRFAESGEAITFSQPQPAAPLYTAWTRRFKQLEGKAIVPSNQHAVKGLILSHGDYRQIAARRHVPSELFRRHPLFESNRAAHSLVSADLINPQISNATFSDQLINRGLVDGAVYDRAFQPDFTFDPEDRSSFAPFLHPQYVFPIDPSVTRDFDNAAGAIRDGSYINKADDGADNLPGYNSSIFNLRLPYWEPPTSDLFPAPFEDRDLQHFAPNRMVPSPVMFGSLPSAVQAHAPWTCLLFRPNLTDKPHLGEWGNGLQFLNPIRTLDGIQLRQFGSVMNNPALPPDHLWLDLFWMPAYAPAHVSGVFTTHGKVNMNYQIFPFTHIQRATAMHAVLKGERLLAIPTTAGTIYKAPREITGGWHHGIDAVETLKQFQQKFDRGEIFLTESEICEQFLIPGNSDVTWDGTGDGIRSFWDRHRLSGDNTLERPYAGLYSRLTTRSNTYRVHYIVQSLRKSVAGDPGTFDSEEDAVTGETCGSALLERVFNADGDPLPNYMDDWSHNAPKLDAYYRTHVTRYERFSER